MFFFFAGYRLAATEWTALVIKMAGSSIVQIQVDEVHRLVALIDGVIQEYDDVVTEIGFNGTTNPKFYLGKSEH